MAVVFTDAVVGLVECPYCGSPQGSRCRRSDGTKPAAHSHEGRVQLALEVVRVAAYAEGYRDGKAASSRS